MQTRGMTARLVLEGERSSLIQRAVHMNMVIWTMSGAFVAMDVSSISSRPPISVRCPLSLASGG